MAGRENQMPLNASLGLVEKVAISSAARIPRFVTEAAKRVGSQSVVAVIDVKKTGLFRRYEFTNNASKKTGLTRIMGC